MRFTPPDNYIATLITAALCLSLCIGCDRNPNVLAPFGWQKIDATIDSLTLLAEDCYYMPFSIDDLNEIITEMDSASSSLSGAAARDTKARTRYWHAYLLTVIGKPDEACDELKMAADIAENQYTLDRISDLKQLSSGYRTLETFKYLLGRLDYYKENKDIVEQANMALMLSNSMQYANVPDISIEYLDLADSLYEKAGLEDRRINVKMNRANILARFSENSDSIQEQMDVFLTDPMIMESPATYETLLRSHYCFFNDSASLFRGYDIVRPLVHPDSLAQGFPAIRGFYEALICQFWVDAARLDSATHYYQLSAKHISELDDITFLANTYQFYSNYFKAIGDTKSELFNLRKYMIANDSLQNMDDPQGKIMLEHINTISKHELESEKIRQSLKIRHYVIISALILLLLIVIAIAVRYRSVQKIKLLNASLENERRQRQILAITLQNEENNRMLGQVREEASRMSKSVNVQPADISRLETDVRLHMAGQNDLSTFSDVFSEISPEFEGRLREIAPDLSLNNIRLCAYISMGMTNQEIADLMHISPGTMRVARHRLRNKLGLDKSDSLEDFLRKLTAR